MNRRLLSVVVLAVAAAVSLFAQRSLEFELQGPQGKLFTVVQRPDTLLTKKIPLVILCHGFGASCRSALFDEIADDLLRNDIAVLRFDFNGHGKSGGEFKDMTVLNEIDDLKNVIKWARSQSWVRSISLLGHSQGGVVASMTAGQLGRSKIKSLVLMAPAAVLRDDALRGNTMGAMYDPWNMADDYVQLPFGGLKLGRGYIETAVNLPIYETAREYVGPVLVIHGTHDRIVPYTYGERYQNEYKKGEIKLIPGEDHSFSVNTPEAARIASAWLSAQLH